MKLLFITAMCILLSGPHSFAQEAAPAASEEDLLLEGMANMRDPFVSPIVRQKLEQPTPQPVPVRSPDPVVAEVNIPVQPVPLPETNSYNSPVGEAQPMVPVFSSAGIKISGIIWNTDLPQAIVNDRVVKVGDDLQGAKIITITKTGIEVIQGGVKYNLLMADKTDAFNGNSNPALMRGGR